MVFFDEPFTSYPLNSSVINSNGWKGSGGFVGADPIAIPSGRYYGGNPFFTIWQFYGPENQAYVYFDLYLEPNEPVNGVVIDIGNTDPDIDTSVFRILGFGIDPDYGAALFCTGGFGLGSYLLNGSEISQSIVQSNFAFTTQNWYFCQLFIKAFRTPQPNGAPDHIGVNSTLAVDGNLVCQGTINDTGQPVTGVYTQDASWNKWLFNNPQLGDGFGRLANITATTSASNPYPGSPYALLTQAPLELIIDNEPIAINVRVSQGVAELMNKVNPNARLSQGVIELITQGAVNPAATGWNIKEI